MNWFLILMLGCVLVSAGFTSYQIYKMVELDAACKGLKHPKFWGLFSLSGSGTSGLLLYLIGSRKYLSTFSSENQRAMNSRKKKAIISFSFLAILAIILFTILVTQY